MGFGEGQEGPSSAFVLQDDGSSNENGGHFGFRQLIAQILVPSLIS